ncbi:UNVERIFIED_CONTAM: hypothetical protein FKN15_039142 [Acipenser sinensis]
MFPVNPHDKEDAAWPVGANGAAAGVAGELNATVQHLLTAMQHQQLQFQELVLKTLGTHRQTGPSQRTTRTIPTPSREAIGPCRRHQSAGIYPEPRGEEPPLPEPRGDEPPLPEPRGEEPPLPEPRGEEPPLPEPRGEEPPLPKPRGEEVKSIPPPQPRPPPLQFSLALLHPVPQPLLLDTLPVFLDLPVLDLEHRSLQHWPQLCHWFPAPLSPSTQTSLGCCQTSLLLPLLAALLPLGDRTSLRQFPGEDLCPLRHPPVPRPTLRSALSARWGPV